MPTATTIIAGAGLALSAGQTLYQASEASDAAAKAERELDAYPRQDLRNTLSGFSVPTEGFKMEQAQLQQTQAELGYQLSQSGARGAIAGASLLSAQSQRSMADISNRLTQKQFEFQNMLASEEARIQQMKERREEQDIAGLGAQIAYNKGAEQQSYQGLVSTVISGAELAQSVHKDNKDKRPK